MTSKIITARLKEPLSTATRIEIDMSNWLEGSAIIEQSKRVLLAKLKDEYHTKIAVMGIDDLEFKVMES